MPEIYAFVSRVPKHCEHGQDHQSIFLVRNPNQTTAEDYVEHGSRTWRNMMIKIRQKQPPPELDAWPDWYYVTFCDACENERRSVWEDLHWDRNPWRRQNKAVYALAYLEVKTEPSTYPGQLSSQLTAQSVEEVLALVKNCRLTRYDFKIIDERPGQWGYEIDGREWHYKLRQVRNRDTRLFDILKANETAGMSDDNAVPPIEPGWQPDHWPV